MKTIPFDIEKAKAGWPAVSEGDAKERYEYVGEVPATLGRGYRHVIASANYVLSFNEKGRSKLGTTGLALLTEDDEGWVYWPGGGITPPVLDHIVSVKLRDETCVTVDPSAVRWSRLGAASDILWYRPSQLTLEEWQDGYIEHHGGSMPVAANVIVKVLTRSRDSVFGNYPIQGLRASLVDWSHGAGIPNVDVVGYRKVGITAPVCTYMYGVRCVRKNAQKNQAQVRVYWYVSKTARDAALKGYRNEREIRIDKVRRRVKS